MRARFLGNDFFNPATVETLDFLHCPPPHLPPSYISIEEDLPRCFDDLSVLSISLEIEKLPIETSLAKFLSDVLPQFIDAQIGDFAYDQSSTETACSRKPWSFGSDCTFETDASQEKNDIFSDDEGRDNPGYDLLKVKDERPSDVKGTNDMKTIQFETPEVHSYFEMKYDLHCQMAQEKIFTEISHVKSELDMPCLELRMHDILEIRQAVYSVDNILTEYFMEQKTDLLEDSGSTGGQLCSSYTPFPVFEIDEASLSIFNDIWVGYELITFNDIVSQICVQERQIPSSDNDHLVSKEFELLAYLSDHCPAMQCPEVEMTCSNFYKEIDFITDTEDSDISEMLLFHQGISQDLLLCSSNIILFEEFQFTGIELYNFVEVFHDLGTVVMIKACDPMFSEAMEFKNFNDLIVCNELILVDDSFKSLPVPIISDSQKIWSLHSLGEKVLSMLEPESSSTFDGLYLDWHVLEADKCDYDRYLPCWRMMEEIDTYSIDYAFSIFDNRMLVLEFILSGDSFDELNLEETKEILNVFSECMSVLPISHNEEASQKLGNDDHKKGITGEMASELGAAKVRVSVDSIAEFNGIDSLLNPLECRGRKYKPSGWSVHKNTALSAVSSGDSIAACAATQVQQWNIKILPVELSDEILAVIDNFRKSYMDILQNESEFMKDLSHNQDLDGISCLRLRKEELIDRIKKISEPGTSSALDNDTIISLVALCAIKQMAWYMCYYGLHPTQLYMHKLSSSLQCIKSRLSFLQNLIEDMCRKAVKEIKKFHPSLSVVQDVLESNFTEIGRKVLVVAEPVFFWPLKKLLDSMGISYHEPQSFWTNTHQQDGFNEFADATSIMFQSDCCLVTHEDVSSSFPFDKFGIVLEYGGSNESSRVCSICLKQENCPRIYFLKVELEDSGVPKAICDGVDMPNITESTMNFGDPHVISVLSVSNNKLEELLNFIPVEENYKRAPRETVHGGEDCCMKPVQSLSLAMESKEIHINKPSSPDTVIVVNTRNFDKEILISRRSTYQKILALEKGGVQVVERDINLPVDVVVNAAICLAWYDLKNIGKKASAPDEAFSCLPLCIENIAASILTSMSYSFSSCILVFEGETNFLNGVMESSDELYAAAASLGIDFQIFCSYSPVMTDEIVLSCIGAVTKLTRGLYPTMADSESLAESFLTAFPSINPLSAHVILSSGGTLVEFLEWSHERRMRAVQKYKVPDESVALLGLMCQYGEREDNKSGMTDSSSSVSYAPDRFQLKSNSEARKRKYIDNLHSVDVDINELSQFEPLSLFSDIELSPPGASAPLNFWMSENSEMIDECGKPGLSSDNELLGQSRKRNANMIMKSSKLSPLHGLVTGQGPPASDESKKPKKHWKNVNFVANKRMDMATWDKSYRHNQEKSGNQPKDLIGEVIDTDVCATFRKDIATLNSFLPHELENDLTSGISRNVRKLSFGASNSGIFSIPAEIGSNPDAWICKSNSENSSRKANKKAPDSSFSNYEFHSKHKKGLLLNDPLQKTPLDSCDQSMQKKDRAHFGGTSLWNAIHSSGCQSLQELPWTIDFLNRIKEKSRARQQSLPCGLSSPCIGSSKNKSNARKRKSPSILEYYKYQRDGVLKQSIEQKRPKQSVKPAFLYKNEKASHSILPTWTPVDKKAKQTLSFATMGNRGQSKLIWSDNDSHPLS